MKNITLLISLLVMNTLCHGQNKPAGAHPNILFIYIDDMGYGDLSCYGNQDMRTPHIDRLAKEGIKFTNFYVASPVCSPSRVGVVTGRYPARYFIYGYLADRWSNEKRNMANWLAPSAPTIAKTFQSNGYATAHIGKWHLGGGFDISKAPLPEVYGYEETLVDFCGLGDRVLVKNGSLHNQASAQLGHGQITWVAHDYQKSGLYVDSTIAFIQRHRQQPFYVELWLNEVHDPFEPNPAFMEKFKRFANDKYKQQYYATLYNADLQIGRLLDFLDRQGLTENTIVLFASDNGPTDWPHYYRDHYMPPGSAGYFRGRKWSLYEGGIREPLLIRWPGHVPAGQVDSTTITCNIDLFPTLCALANVPPPDVSLDGENMRKAWLGHPRQRDQLLKWVFGFNNYFIKPGNPRYRSPDLAIRDGQWKLLVNEDGSGLELYNLRTDIAEAKNVAKAHPGIAQKLSEEVIDWWQSMPKKKGL